MIIIVNYLRYGYYYDELTVFISLLVVGAVKWVDVEEELKVRLIEVRAASDCMPVWGSRTVKLGQVW